MNEDQDVPRSSAHALPSVGETKPPKRLKFLIANLELEFRVSHIRINDLIFSNRKKITVLALISQAWERRQPVPLPALTPPAAFPIIAGFFRASARP
jgi:hypothetical protein